MDTKQILDQSNPSLRGFLPEYKPAVITKTDSQEAYGIAAQIDCESDALYIKEIGTDKELVLSMVDTLNYYRVPYAHFLDVISDLMKEQC